MGRGYQCRRVRPYPCSALGVDQVTKPNKIVPAESVTISTGEPVPVPGLTGIDAVLSISGTLKFKSDLDINMKALKALVAEMNDNDNRQGDGV